MKKTLRAFFCYIIISKVILYADIEQSNLTYHSHSLHLFSNPSIISTQQGIPFSAVFFIPSAEEILEAATSFSIILDKNAFSIGYERNEILKNRFISGYSFKKEFFYFGSSFSFLIDSSKDPNFLLDVSSTIKLPQSRFISLVFNNIQFTEKVHRSISPKGSISFFGDIPWIEKNLGFDFSYYCIIDDLKEGRIDHGAKINIVGTFFNHPLMYYSAGYDLFGGKYSKINQFFCGNLGLQLKINEISTGLSYGVKYSINNSDYKMNLQLNFNPTIIQYNQKAQINLKVMKASEKNPGVYVSFDYLNFSKSSGIKNWVLVFSSSPSNEGKIIKSFSGGELPPSSIHWDLKDVSGKFYDQEVIYIRGIITDTFNKISVTPWITFYPHK